MADMPKAPSSHVLEATGGCLVDDQFVQRRYPGERLILI